MVMTYTKHEKSTFKEVTKARSALKSSKSAQDSAKAENMLTSTLRSLMLVVENYPKLEASKNFSELRTDLKQIEDSIAQYREEYNKSVQKYNNSTQTFPNVLIASILGFQKEQLFQITKTTS